MSNENYIVDIVYKKLYNIVEEVEPQERFMGKPTRLTKEDLIKLGVTDVYKNGTVYVQGTKKNPRIVKGPARPYGTQCEYLVISFQDYSVKYKTIQRAKRKDGSIYEGPAWSYKVRNIPLGRVMLAWFTGSIEADEDADHIDGDTFNNHLDNLQKLSRKANLAKRTLSWEEIYRIYNSKKKELEKEDK